MNIVDLIREETLDYYDCIAIVESTKKILYKELFIAIDSLKDKLASCGIGGFKRVALFYEDSIEYVILCLSVLSLKGVIVPISPSLAWDEIESVIERIDVEFFLSYKKVGYFEGNTTSIKFGEESVFLYHRSLKNVISDEYCSSNPAFVRFSSGTTNTSKGVVLSHEAILDRTNAANKGLDITAEDNIIWVLSMSYHFVVTIILFLRKAATIILCEKDFPFVFIKTIKTGIGTLIYSSPFHYQIMKNRDELSKEMLAGVRLAISTAVEFSVKGMGQFYEKFGVEINEAYGIIEVGLPFINLSKDEKKRGSVGRVLPDYKINIKNPDKKGIGAVYLKGKGMFDAYFSPWVKRKILFEDGWFNTGDLGYIDGDGYLFLEGRKKNIINFSGMKIFPQEVERILNSYKEVKESYVYGVSDLQYGQIPHADLVIGNNVGNEFNIQKIRAFCYAKLSSYKVPKEFKIVQTIEKTGTGKIKRIK